MTEETIGDIVSKGREEELIRSVARTEQRETADSRLRSVVKRLAEALNSFDGTQGYGDGDAALVAEACELLGIPLIRAPGWFLGRSAPPGPEEIEAKAMAVGSQKKSRD